MVDTRTSPRSSQLVLTSDGQVIGPSGRPLKLSPGTGGYLRVSYRHDDGRKTTATVHVLVCEAFHGPRPNGMVARHRNGNKLDNRPANVCWGTPRENYDDRDAHGGTARGERQGLSKLTEADIPQIRALLRQGRTQREVAERFGVSDVTVSAVARGRTWSHVPDENDAPAYRAGLKGARGENNGNARLTSQQVQEIRRFLADRVPQRAIASRYGVSQGLISKIKRGSSWTHYVDSKSK